MQLQELRTRSSCFLEAVGQREGRGQSLGFLQAAGRVRLAVRKGVPRQPLLRWPLVMGVAPCWPGYWGAHHGLRA